MKLTFKRDEVKKLVEHTKNAEEHMSLGKVPETKRAGLLLVGDKGVYLMSNAKDHLRRDESDPEDKRSFVAYANECNPDKMDLDDWRYAKGASFGGDDGADFIPIEDIERGLKNSKKKDGALTLDVTPQSIGVMEWQADPDYDAKVQKYHEARERLESMRCLIIGNPNLVAIWNNLLGKSKRARKIENKTKHMQTLIKRLEEVENSNRRKA